MAIPASGVPIALTTIATEFNDTAPHELAEFYRGGGKVPDTAGNLGAGIPISGAIGMGSFYGSANRVAYTLTIASNTTNYDVYANRGPSYVAGGSDITVSINPAVTVSSTTSPAYALAVPASFSPTDTITVVNNGTIVGAGGNGGDGGGGTGSFHGPTYYLHVFPTITNATAGGAGGGGIYVNRPTTITNNGTIAGGGGGGGGGGGWQGGGSCGKGCYRLYDLGGQGGGGGAGDGAGSGGTGGVMRSGTGSFSTASGTPYPAPSIPDSTHYKGNNGSAGTSVAGGAAGSGYTPSISLYNPTWSPQFPGPGNPYYIPIYGALQGPGGVGGGLGSAGGAGQNSPGNATINPSYSQIVGTYGAGGNAGNYITGNAFVTWPANGTRTGGIA